MMASNRTREEKKKGKKKKKSGYCLSFIWPLSSNGSPRRTRIGSRTQLARSSPAGGRKRRKDPKLRGESTISSSIRNVYLVRGRGEEGRSRLPLIIGAGAALMALVR